MCVYLVFMVEYSVLLHQEPSWTSIKRFRHLYSCTWGGEAESSWGALEGVEGKLSREETSATESKGGRKECVYRGWQGSGGDSSLVSL